jgi:hypothetical protein
MANLKKFLKIFKEKLEIKQDVFEDKNIKNISMKCPLFLKIKFDSLVFQWLQGKSIYCISKTKLIQIDQKTAQIKS